MSRPRVIFTAGGFDLLHRGHINILWASRQLGDVLVVGIVSDLGLAEYKGRYPLRSLDKRIRDVETLGLANGGVWVQESTDPTPLLERFRPDAMTHGDDWSRLREGHETLDRLGIEWVPLPYTPGISTTMLRAAPSPRVNGAARV